MFETFDRAVSTTRKHKAILFCPPQGAIGMLEEAKKKPRGRTRGIIGRVPCLRKFSADDQQEENFRFL